jgi:putative intracellular protease/amidase
MIENFLKYNKPVAFVCHVPGASIKVKVQNSDLLFKGKNVKGFSATEKAAIKLTDAVPFLLEDELKSWAGTIVKELTGAVTC